MRTQRSADMCSGLFVAAVGLVVIVASFGIKSAFAERLPPRTLPLVLGWTTLLTGALLAIRAFRHREEEVPMDWPDAAGWRRVLVTLGSLLGYLLLVEPLGLPIASLVFVVFLIRYLDGGFIRGLCVGLATALLLRYGFVDLLQLQLPLGFWAQ